jgi:hypothetical protein
LIAEWLHQAIVKARINAEFQEAVDDAAPINPIRDPPLAPAPTPFKLEGLVIRLGECGGVLHTQLELAKHFHCRKKSKEDVCSPHSHDQALARKRAFVIEDIRADKFLFFDSWKEKSEE